MLAKSGRGALRAGGAGLFCALLVGIGPLSHASAQEFDPSIPIRVPTDPARGPAVAERLDRRGTNVSAVRLPHEPRVTFQVRVTGPILGAPLADKQGRIAIAHGSGRLTAIDLGGRTLWTLRLGELLGAPVALGAGRLLAVTREGEFVLVSGAGRTLARERMPFGDLDGLLVTAPTTAGGAIIAVGARYARIDESASVVATGAAAAPIGAVFDWRGSMLLVDRDGRILAHAPALDATEIGRLGGPASRVTLLGDKLFALVGEHTLIVFDLKTRQAERRFLDAALALRDLVVHDDGSTRLLAAGGTLIELDATGREMARVELLPDGAGGESTTLLADRTGTVLAVMSGAPLMLIPRGREPIAVPSTGCPDPVRPTPLADGVILTGCRSGVLRGLSDTSR